MPKVGGRRKKVRSHKQITAEEEGLVPTTFVVKKGRCSAQLRDTVSDLRKCFYPNTAMKLEDSSRLALKSYLKAARYYNVKHLLVLQQTKTRTYFRCIDVAGGEMTFRVVNYCRMKDVLKHGGAPFCYSFRQPLLVLNNFTDTPQLRMIAKGLQQVFPALDVEKVDPNILRRVLSFTYLPKKKFIYFRHYKIIVRTDEIPPSLDQLINNPIDLSGFKTIGEFLHRQSEQRHSQHAEGDNHQRVKLLEMGPRMKLRFLSYKQKHDNTDEQNNQQMAVMTDEAKYLTE